MKEVYRNGEYTMELSPNHNQWLVYKEKKCVATLDVEWVRRREGTPHYNPMWLLKGLLCWYYSI